jgi:acetyl-CoA synthetase
MPYFDPNCYGFVNFFDGVALWPDQVVGKRRGRGVALICQSGTIALNLLFNDRSLPIGCVLTVGNQTRLAAEDLIELLTDDDRVTGFGLYLEGIRDARHFAAVAARARAAGKPIALVKAGRTEAATATVRTHTGSLAGADGAFDAFCAQAGIARCESLATLCETYCTTITTNCTGAFAVYGDGALQGGIWVARLADRANAVEVGAPIPLLERATSLARSSLRRSTSPTRSTSTPISGLTGPQRAMFDVVLRAGYDAVGFCCSTARRPPGCRTPTSTSSRFAAALPGQPPGRCSFLAPRVDGGIHTRAVPGRRHRPGCRASARRSRH